MRILQRVRSRLAARAAGVAARTDRPAGGAGHEHRHDQRRGAAPAAGSGRGHRQDTAPGPARGADHKRVPADRRADPSAQRRGARPSANQHRQRDAGGGLEEEPEGAGPQTPVAGGSRGVPRQHQHRSGFVAGLAVGRAGGGAARQPTGVYLYGGDSARPVGPDEAARCGAARSVPSDQGSGQAQLLTIQPVPGQYGRGSPERVALPGRRALPLYLRGRAGALLLAAAGLSG